MLASTNAVIGVIVPQAAASAFVPAWIIASLAQPLNALAFITDGIHWGTGDYRYLRNGMMAATCCGVICLFLIDIHNPGAFVQVWLVVGLWIVVRSIFGMVRIWPGVGASPLRPATLMSS
jgi:MATE family multidrug resistance protein